MIQSKNTVENSNIALVTMDNEVLIRRIIKVGDTTILHPENMAYTDAIFAKRESHEIRAMGIVKSVIFEV